MPKNDNAHSLRMVSSLRDNIGESAAEDFENSYPLSKSADIDKRFHWAEDTCRYLEERFDENTIVQIRKACRCNDGKTIAAKLLKYWNKAQTTQDFVELFNENETFANLEYIEDRRVLFCYPQCYCACVKRIPKEISRTWCYCTLGNAEGIFEKVFHKAVKVRLLESIKSGGKRCAIEVSW